MIRRAASSLVLVWLVLSATFAAIHIAPGVPSILLQSPTVAPQQQEVLVHALGLDRSLGQQYILWLGAVAHGDWGTSFAHGRPVAALLSERLPATILLGSTSLLVALVFGIPLALYSARHAGSPSDYAIQLVSTALYSVPQFWLALISILLFSYVVPLFPAGHLHDVGVEALAPLATFTDLLHHLTLPSMVLGLTMAAGICRMLRNRALEILGRNYIRAARAKGLSELRVLCVHVLPNSIQSVVQLLGLALPLVFGGVLVTEVVFSWPGVGRLTYDALQARDYPLILGATALTAVLVVCGTFLADTLELFLDPRLRPLERP